MDDWDNFHRLSDSFQSQDERYEARRAFVLGQCWISHSRQHQSGVLPSWSGNHQDAKGTQSQIHLVHGSPQDGGNNQPSISNQDSQITDNE